MFQRNLNKELTKNASFISLASELFRFTETYATSSLENESESLLTSNLIIDFRKDLNIRELQFIDVFDNYKKVIEKLNRLNCLDCPRFTEHVKFQF